MPRRKVPILTVTGFPAVLQYDIAAPSVKAQARKAPDNADVKANQTVGCICSSQFLTGTPSLYFSIRQAAIVPIKASNHMLSPRYGNRVQNPGSHG